MKRWPAFEVTETYNKKTEKHKCVAKTKLPCGVPMVHSAESENKLVASGWAKGNLLDQAKEHVDKHKCGS